MELTRQKELVVRFHYDLRLPEHKDLKTAINVAMSPFKDAPGKPEGASAIQTHVDFFLVFDKYIISGIVSQMNFILNREIKEEKDLNEEEVRELVEPLFEIIKRMTYEVTEVATDMPGQELNFGPQMRPQ